LRRLIAPVPADARLRERMYRQMYHISYYPVDFILTRPCPSSRCIRRPGRWSPRWGPRFSSIRFSQWCAIVISPILPVLWSS